MSLSGGRGLILWTQRSGGSSVFQYKVKLLMGKGTGHHYIQRNYRIFRLRIHLGFCKCYRRFMILSYITCGEITFITLSGGPGQAFKDLSLADFLILFGKTRYLTLWFDLKFWQCYCKLLINYLFTCERITLIILKRGLWEVVVQSTTIYMLHTYWLFLVEKVPRFTNKLKGQCPKNQTSEYCKILNNNI